MTLIKSISGIRGTIGGVSGENLTPVDILKFSLAYGVWLKETRPDKRLKVVIGRDARISGKMLRDLIVSTLSSIGIDVVDIGLATTPTTELTVTELSADGGIILTASHNPMQWNALKLLNHSGEFLSDSDGQALYRIAADESLLSNLIFSEIESIGTVQCQSNMLDHHIQLIKSLSYVNNQAIEAADLIVAVDGVNSVGGIAIPALLRALGVKEIIEINCDPSGYFAHNPEPLPEHLKEISKQVVESGAHIGFVVDPDVDRLAIINEDGTMFGEENTLIAVADFILKQRTGNAVSNLSSSRGLRDICQKYGVDYAAAAVGEVNVVKKMKEINAIIGGEGNGGVILPELHYGRDALVGIALFLSYMAEEGKKPSELKAALPSYHISKNKMDLASNVDLDILLLELKQQYSSMEFTTIDGIKIDFPDKWVHLRKSNTEAILRIYAEAKTRLEADALAQEIIDFLKNKFS